jgi:hypothetical protein
MRKTLTDRGIKALKPGAQAYVQMDAIVPNLGIRTMPSGHKTFVLVTRFPSSPHPTPKRLGSYGELSLEQARAKGRTWLELLGQGKDPVEEEARLLEENQRSQANTFAVVVEDFVRLVAVGPDPANPYQRKGLEVARDLRRVFVPIWGRRPIASITRREVLAVVEGMRDRPAHTTCSATSRPCSRGRLSAMRTGSKYPRVITCGQRESSAKSDQAIESSRTTSCSLSGGRRRGSAIRTVRPIACCSSLVCG